MKLRIAVLAFTVLVAIAWTAGAGSVAVTDSSIKPDLAKAEYAPGELLVKFKPEVKVNLERGLTSSAKLDALLAEYGLLSLARVFNVEKPVSGETYTAPGGMKKPLPDLAHTYRLRFAKTTDIRPLLARLKADSAVVYAEPNYVRRASLTPTPTRTRTPTPSTTPPVFTPNDPYYSSSGSWRQSFRDMYGLYNIQAAAAWGVTGGSSSIVVAVIDTGADVRHVDLAANLVAGYDFVSRDADPTDGHGHGTHVAGTIAAVTNNGLGVAGIAWNCKIMPLKGLDDEGSGYDSDLADAVRYAADHGAKVTNNSWGSTGYSQTLDDAFSYAYGRGVVSVAAAGNSQSSEPHYPSALDTVISVSATDYQDRLASFSNFGPTVDVAAPGVEILSLRAAGTDMYGDGRHIVGGQYYYASGTSMASPHTAGVAALIRSLHPTWMPAEVLGVLAASADDLGTPGRDDQFGHGRINAFRATQITTPPPTPTPSPTPVCLVQSDHPYADNYDHTWTLTNPDTQATSSRIHFFRLETEQGYDHVVIIDGSGRQVQSFSGAYSAFWSSAVPGRTVQVRLTTDASVVRWGFCVDQIANGGVITEEPTVTPTTPATADAYEPDNTPAQARAIIVDGAVQQHNFHLTTDEDWVSFSASQGQWYNITTSNLGPDADTVLELYDRGGTTLLTSNDDCDSLASCISWQTAPAGTYFIKVRPYSSGRTGERSDYDLRVARTVGPTPTVTPSPTPTRLPPDGSGYTWEVVPLNWVDISTTGTLVAQGDDTFEQVPLGFSFRFYGLDYDSAYVGSNGFVSFGEGFGHFMNASIPDASPPNNAIYAFWDDLFPIGGSSGNVYAQQLDANRYAFQWQNVVRYGGITPETFQIILNRSDRTILLQYAAVAETGSATVGVEDSAGLGGTQYAYDTPGQIFNGLALRFAPRPMPRPSVTPSAFSVTLRQAETTTRQLTIANSGQATLTFSLLDVETSSASNDATWLTTAPVTGTIAAGASAPVILNLNAIGLSAGAYTANLLLTHNGERPNPILIPITVSVTADLGEVSISVDPPTRTVSASETFPLDILLAAGRAGVDVVDAYLDFDPAIIEVVQIVPGSALPVTLRSDFDNQMGRINYSAGTLSSPLSTGSFTLATVQLRAKAPSLGSAVSFATTLPRRTDAFIQGVSVLGAHRDGIVVVQPGAWLVGSVALQGRPTPPHASWSTPLTVTLGGTTYAATTDTSGVFTITGLVSNTYDIRVKGQHTLQNLRQGVALGSGVNRVDMGTLREGDANGDNCVMGMDFSILRATYGRSIGEPAYDPRADFNADGLVAGGDFSLLRANYGRCGALLGAESPAQDMPWRANAAVVVAVTPASTTVAVGQVFTVTIRLIAGTQPVDTIDAFLNFDPTYLQVVDHEGKPTANISPGTTLPVVLLNTVDNNLGRIDYAAGILIGAAPTGTFTVATIGFKAMAKTANTALSFALVPGRYSDVIYDRGSVLDEWQDGFIEITEGSLTQMDVCTLLPGWNLISLPLAPQNTVITQALESIVGHFDLAYAYDAANQTDPWKKYNVAAPAFLNTLRVVSETQGLWIRASDAVSLTITGTVGTWRAVSLRVGWNLVGYPSQTTRPVTVALQSIDGEYDLVYAYDAANQTDPWKKYNVAAPAFLNTLKELGPGWGYWIRAKEDCVWMVP